MDTVKATVASQQTAMPEDPPMADNESGVYPDGGLKAWLVVLGSWCAALPSFGLMNTTGVFADWIATNQLDQYSRGAVSWIFSVHIFFLLIGGIQIGPVFDRYGPKQLLILGTIGLTAAMMFFSVSKEYYQFMLSFGVLGGISASMIFTPSVSVITHWFHKRRALATGIIATAGSIGGIIFPQIFNALAPKVGFGWAIRTLGFIALFFSSIGALLQKSRLKPKKGTRKTVDFRVLREFPFTLTTVAIIFADIGALIPVTYLTSYGRANTMSIEQSYSLTSILNAASVLGRLMPAYVADRYGRFNAMIVTTGISAILTLSLWLKSGTSHAAIIAFTVLFGFWSGSAIGLSPVCVAQISKTEDFGKRYGTTYAFVSVGVLVALPIAGQILKAQTHHDKEDYWGLIVFCGVAYGLSATFFTLARGFLTGWKFRQCF